MDVSLVQRCPTTDGKVAERSKIQKMQVVRINSDSLPHVITCEFIRECEVDVSNDRHLLLFAVLERNQPDAFPLPYVFVWKLLSERPPCGCGIGEIATADCEMIGAPTDRGYMRYAEAPGTLT